MITYWGINNDPRPSASGHYGCPQANTKAIQLKATINLFIDWLLNLKFWVLLGHYRFY